MGFRKAMVLSLARDRAEMEELLYSLGIEAVATLTQRRPRPDPQTYLGRGKLAEAREAAWGMDLDIIVVDAELRPGQVFALESFFNEGRGAGGQSTRRREKRIEVYDRVRVILEIFKDRARSPEARLQVELAELRYQIPIVKEFVHFAKMGERPGFLAGGSYGVEDELDMMRARMARIRHDLARIRTERAVRRKHRRRAGFSLVALAGYTNAGKSSLLRALAGEDVLVENRYFSTLSTRTGRVEGIRGRDVLMTDTVGFIEDLPPWIVEAFHATLEEINLSDVILLVLDASDPYEEVVRRLRTSERILARFEAAAIASTPREAAIERVGAAAATGLQEDVRGETVEQRGSQGAAQREPGEHRRDPTKLLNRGDAVQEPDEPAEPDAYGMPDEQRKSEEPGRPEEPGKSEEPSRPEDPGKLDRPGLPLTKLVSQNEAEPGPDDQGLDGVRGRERREREPARSASGLGAIIVVFNKRDAMPREALDALTARLEAEGHLQHPWTCVSARTGEGLDALSAAIVGALPSFEAFVVEADHEHGGAALLAWIYEHADVRTLVSDDVGFRASVLVAPARRSALLDRVQSARGRAYRDPLRDGSTEQPHEAGATEDEGQKLGDAARE